MKALSFALLVVENSNDASLHREGMQLAKRHDVEVHIAASTPTPAQ